MKKKVMVLVGEIEVDFDPHNYVDEPFGPRSIEGAARFENELIKSGDLSIGELLVDATELRIEVRVRDADVPPVG